MLTLDLGEALDTRFDLRQEDDKASEREGQVLERGGTIGETTGSEESFRYLVHAQGSYWPGCVLPTDRVWLTINLTAVIEHEPHLAYIPKVHVELLLIGLG